MMNKKKFLFFTTLFLSFSLSVFSKNTDETIHLADSLFKVGLYTQSFDLYDEILTQNKKASPSMLLKMAYIKEGLDDAPGAMFYLQLYYNKTYNTAALKKMEKLAEKHELTGYDYNDAEFFLNLYERHTMQIYIGVLSILAFLCLMVAYQWYRFGTPNRDLAITSVIIMVVILAGLNFFSLDEQGIIISDHVPLMSGPSSGSNVVTFAENGHKVKILDEEDVWAKIQWQDTEVYIKKDQLKTIKL